MTTPHPLAVGENGNSWDRQPTPPAVDPRLDRNTTRRPSILDKWPTWAHNTVILAGVAAILIVVFFAGFFTASGTHRHNETGIGSGSSTNQQFGPGGSGSGFGNGTMGGNSGQGTGTGTSSGS